MDVNMFYFIIIATSVISILLINFFYDKRIATKLDCELEVVHCNSAMLAIGITIATLTLGSYIFNTLKVETAKTRYNLVQEMPVGVSRSVYYLYDKEGFIMKLNPEYVDVKYTDKASYIEFTNYKLSFLVEEDKEPVIYLHKD